jgi:hypothetical protein
VRYRFSQLLKITGLPLVCAACFSLPGGHWMALQMFAWAQMLRDYSRNATITVAIQKTFSGTAPCMMCARGSPRDVRIYRDVLSLQPYVLLGLNFGYNTRDYYGWNNFQFGLKATWKINRIVSVFGGVSYSVAMTALKEVDPRQRSVGQRGSHTQLLIGGNTA